MDIKWRDQRFAYDGSDNLIYLGRSIVPIASTSSGGLWWVWKYSYDGSDNLTRIQGPESGNWDDRASLTWT